MSNYWHGRVKARLLRSEQIGLTAMNRVMPLYEQALKNINKDINSIYVNYSNKVGLDVGELTQILSGVDKNNFLKNIQAKMKALGFNVGEIYDKNYIARLTRLEALKQQVYWEIQGIAPKETAISTNAYQRIISESYRASRGDIRKQLYRGGTFASLDTAEIRDVLTEVWQDRTYEISIYQNVTILGQDLKKIIGGGLQIGISQEKMAQQVRELGDIGKYRAMRLIRTETNYFQNQAELESYKDEGIKYYRFDAVMDGRTSKVCSNLDGKVFKVEEAIVGETYPPLHPNCFVHHSVKIFTEDGIKTINKIKVGDKVLTHMGRFRKVKELLHSDGYIGDVVDIRFKGKVYGSTNKRNSIVVTPEHPILTQRGWVMAKDILLNDFLYVIAKRCKTCGDQMPYWRDKYCSMACNTENTEQIREQGFKNKGENNGMFNRTGSLSPNWLGGKIWWRGKEWDTVKLKARERDNFSCQECNMTESEHIEKYKQPLQVHHINPYRYSKDNSLDNLVTLCCVCHRRVEGTTNKEVLNSGSIEYMSIPVLDVRLLHNYKVEKRYNFSVEEDESYVAQGVVVHNCRSTTTVVFDEEAKIERVYSPEDIQEENRVAEERGESDDFFKEIYETQMEGLKSQGWKRR
jgi:SPP1 gp7 family putative phage head morphogenesis protein